MVSEDHELKTFYKGKLHDGDELVNVCQYIGIGLICIRILVLRTIDLTSCIKQNIASASASSARNEPRHVISNSVVLWHV